MRGRKWRECSPALEPTLTLARRAHDTEAFAVFFITGRPSSASRRDRTQPARTRLYLGRYREGAASTENAKFASAVDFKASGAPKVAERGYTILLTLGDQESDLKGGYAEWTFSSRSPSTTCREPGRPLPCLSPWLEDHKVKNADHDEPQPGTKASAKQ